MKILTISYVERKNKGNYEHEEMSASANIDDGESFAEAMTALKNAVHSILYGITDVPTKEVTQPIKEVVSEEPKAKKTKKVVEAKSEVESANIPPVISDEVVKEHKKVKSNVQKYDSALPEHKSIFGGYLAKKYNTAWKTIDTPENIKAFTSGLNGQDFIDDKGQIVPTFLEQVHTFFGA
jgi:hypothetical protein